MSWPAEHRPLNRLALRRGECTRSQRAVRERLLRAGIRWCGGGRANRHGSGRGCAKRVVREREIADNGSPPRCGSALATSA